MNLGVSSGSHTPTVSVYSLALPLPSCSSACCNPPHPGIRYPPAFPTCLSCKRQTAMGSCPFEGHHLLSAWILLPRKRHPQPQMPLERHCCCESGRVSGKPSSDGSTLFLSHWMFHTRRLLVDPAGHSIGVSGLTLCQTTWRGEAGGDPHHPL